MLAFGEESMAPSSLTKKNKFWIGGDATSRCLEELARTVHSLLVDLLVDLSRSQITRPVLKK